MVGLNILTEIMFKYVSRRIFYKYSATLFDIYFFSVESQNCFLTGTCLQNFPTFLATESIILAFTALFFHFITEYYGIFFINSSVLLWPSEP
jgi:hypothetical protein